MLLLFLGYLAGLLTLLNPCVLPILPIVISSALQENKKSPIFVATGLSLSTCVAGFLISFAGQKVGIDQSVISSVGALFLVFFGTLILFPNIYSPFTPLSYAVAGISGWTTNQKGSQISNILVGAALGLAWSPCIGPTMGAAVALASTGTQLGLSFAVMFAYGAGIGTIFLLLSYGGRKVIRTRNEKFRAQSRTAFIVFGAITILLGLMILSGIHETLEYWLVGIMPTWLISLSVKY